MNANEKVMLGMIAERLEHNGNAIMGIYNLLHEGTQQELLSLAPDFFRFAESWQFKKEALDAVRTMLSEA